MPASPELAAPQPETAPELALPTEAVRLGLDFGTSTILLAVKVGNRAPRVVPLESQDDAMPAFFWRDAQRRDHFGAEALAFPAAVHSIKLALHDPEKVSIPREWGLEPPNIALLLLAEALRRGIRRLQVERVLPATIEDLRLETNVGCTPLFSLQQRLVLRDICRELALDVKLTNVLEEPTAAAFEVSTTGLSTGGRTMIIDIGGGTLDVCVLDVLAGVNRFRIFATGGEDLGGDRYTDVIAMHLRGEIASRLGAADIDYSIQDQGLLWQRAEDAKIRLTLQPRVRVALGGIAGLSDAEVELTREWFDKAIGGLVEKSVSAVTNVYRRARFSLDRGGEFDPKPGGPVVECHPDGRFVSVSQLKLIDDGRAHLDWVFLVGGGARIPRLQDRFRSIFGERLLDLELYGLDPVTPIVLGLARHQPLDSIQLQYPNWAIDAVVSDQPEPIQLFEPFAPIYDFSWSEPVSFRSCVDLAASSVPRTLALQFRPIGKPGKSWPPVSLGAGPQKLDLRIDLFGNIRLTANGQELYSDHPSAPWKAADSPDRPAWLPAKWTPPEPDSTLVFDPRNAGPG